MHDVEIEKKTLTFSCFLFSFFHFLYIRKANAFNNNFSFSFVPSQEFNTILRRDNEQQNIYVGTWLGIFYFSKKKSVILHQSFFLSFVPFIDPAKILGSFLEQLSVQRMPFLLSSNLLCDISINYNWHCHKELM